MPGLIRGVARTAAIAGTATAVSNLVSRRQATRWANQATEQVPVQQVPVQQAPVAPPAPAPASMDEKIEQLTQLTQLGKLRDAGVLTDEEFAAQKAKLLG